MAHDVHGQLYVGNLLFCTWEHGIPLPHLCIIYQSSVAVINCITVGCCRCLEMHSHYGNKDIQTMFCLCLFDFVSQGAPQSL
ncbi:hypothetical protein XELAEV_18044262mg [Xenopus laevis]|uniref:Uncharacterized protein n=1 Tax=Xenopus laevis TaxID=8355 RepID=A0A974BY65_XENLA|nr:hypothetical protein XELAEV_18044262mg [Xenopus laevis]